MNKKALNNPYTVYYRITANNTKGTTVSTINVSGFNDGDYVILTFPKQKKPKLMKRLSQRLMSALRRR